MKTLAILFTLFYFLNALAVAPYGFKGQQQSTTLYSNVLQGQNNLVTNMGGINALLETGNKNILTNPSFEHATFSTGWTNSAGTFTADTVVEIDGLKAAKLVLSAQTMSLTQSSTLYAAQFADGVQGLASVRIKSDVALKVCSIQAGTVSTTNCVDVTANNKWGHFKVPFIFGATSQGISIASASAVTGTVYIDDAFLGAVDLQASVDSSKLAGESYFAAGGAFSTTSFASASGTRSPTIVLQNEGSWQTSALAGYQQTINNLPPGCYTYAWTFGAAGSNIGAIQQFAGAINGTTQSGSQTYFTQGSGMGSGLSVVGSHCITNSQNVTYELRGSSSAGSVTPGFGVINFNLQKFSSGSTYSSTNADTNWASCGLTGAAFTGFGSAVPIPSLQCRREGSDLLIKGNFTAGTTPTAVEARMALPVWNGVQLVSANSSVIPSVQNAGKGNVNNASVTFFSGITALIEPSVSYITFGLEASSANGATKQNGNAIWSSGLATTISARIPIEGWQGSNIIVGSFNGLQNCTDTIACTDTFSAAVSSAGVVSKENTDWLNGNCSVSATSTYTCNFNSSIFTVAPNCVFISNSGANMNLFQNIPTTASSVQPRSQNNLNVDTAQGFDIICQKQGADYVGKTALAVASDQNIRTPGVTKAVVYSAFIGAAGTVISEIGDLISGSCTVATTNVFTCSFTAGIFASDPVCQITVMGISGASRSVYIVTSPTTSGLTYLTYNTSGPTAGALNVQLTCHGVSP